MTSRVAHFDCFSGISGDMTLGALVDAGVDPETIRAGIDSLQLDVKLDIQKVRKGGFAATRVKVIAPEEHAHRHLPDIEAILEKGSLSANQKDLALRIFRRLAEAEAEAHGMPLEKVHFHEVGALDSIADIVGAAIGLDALGAERFTSRSVPTGVGTVKCEHGTMPIPAPGTAALLKGVPLAPSKIKAELTTPTGAAILTTVVSEWTDSPVMTVESIGQGAGQKDFLDQPNLLRLFVGTVEAGPTESETDHVWLMETNLDDIPGEVVGYCQERLFEAGALDVFTIPIQMKKSRPGVMLCVLASEDTRDALESILFRETATFGIRRSRMQRSKLEREPAVVETEFGPIQGKRGRDTRLDGGVFTPEYEDCVRVAREHDVPLREIYESVRRASDKAQ